MARAPADFPERPRLAELQASRLQGLLQEIIPGNAFWTRKFAAAGLDPASVRTPADLTRLPATTKTELLADQQAYQPYGSGLTYPVQRYFRLHQTSGTSGRPLRWLDTPESWRWMLDCWEAYFQIIGLRTDERLFFPFSFGPFLGFWSAFEAACRRGNLCLPGGGMSSSARLRFLRDHEVTVVFCTPTYALRLAEVAREEGLDLASLPVRALVVAGEPGAGIPATRQRIETAWHARIFDQNGLTEMGPTGIECPENPAGLHLLETEYLVEVIDPETGQPRGADEVGELVLTNLGRWGSPLLRYRTGDLVRVDPEPCPCGLSLVRLAGGILGRADDMIQVKGNNIYPGTLEAIIRRFSEVAEFQVEVDCSGPMHELRIEVEPEAGAGSSDLAERVSQAIRTELLFRAEVKAVAPGSIPRSEMKSRRVRRV